MSITPESHNISSAASVKGYAKICQDFFVLLKKYSTCKNDTSVAKLTRNRSISKLQYIRISLYLHECIFIILHEKACMVIRLLEITRIHTFGTTCLKFRNVILYLYLSICQNHYQKNAVSQTFTRYVVNLLFLFHKNYSTY